MLDVFRIADLTTLKRRLTYMNAQRF